MEERRKEIKKEAESVEVYEEEYYYGISK